VAAGASSPHRGASIKSWASEMRVIFFYFGSYGKHFFTNGSLSKHFSYMDPSTGRHPSWRHRWIVGRQGQWHPSMSSWRVVAPRRTRRMPPSLTPLGHCRAPTRLAPFGLYQFERKLSSFSFFLPYLTVHRHWRSRARATPSPNPLHEALPQGILSLLPYLVCQCTII
jgi:hypothetical protein